MIRQLTNGSRASVQRQSTHLSETGVKDGIGDLVGDLVWVTFTDGLGGEEEAAGVGEREEERERKASSQHQSFLKSSCTNDETLNRRRTSASVRPDERAY